MGSGAGFREGRFDEYVMVDFVCGVKVLTKKNKKSNEIDNTPAHSHTPNTMYARRNQNGEIVQIAVYENNVKVKDIEWGHNHKPFKKGDIHVQEYIDGIRQEEPRSPTEEEKLLAEKVRSKNNE